MEKKSIERGAAAQLSWVEQKPLCVKEEEMEGVLVVGGGGGGSEGARINNGVR